MKSISYTCDRCGAANAIENAVVLDVRHYLDAAGSRDTDVDALDLCAPCIVKLVAEEVAPESAVQLLGLSHKALAQWLTASLGKRLNCLEAKAWIAANRR